MKDLYFNYQIDTFDDFKETCSFYYAIKSYVEALGGHWHFIECLYDPAYPAYQVTYISVDKRKVTLTVLARGGKYPPDISHTFSTTSS